MQVSNEPLNIVWAWRFRSPASIHRYIKEGGWVFLDNVHLMQVMRGSAGNATIAGISRRPPARLHAFIWHFLAWFALPILKP